VSRGRRGGLRSGLRTGQGQRGLTLVELMIAMLISSLLIGMVFSIYTRMSVAYRQQTLVSELQQTLRAAQSVVLRDLRQAGYLIPDGVHVGDVDPLTAAYVARPALSVDNNADGTGPDSITMYYADGNAAQARVLTLAPIAAFVSATVDDSTGFDTVTRAVLVNMRVPTDTTLDGVAPFITTEACAVNVTDATAGTITFDAAPYCATLAAAHNAAGGALRTMIYPLVGRSYRIDPARKELSVFQQSPSGGLTPNDWSDLGIGFTDFQIASRFSVELVTGSTAPPPVDEDGDGDAEHDWYSAANQELANLDVQYPDDDYVKHLTQLGVSFAVRTYENVNLVPTKVTPAFIDDSSAAATEHNRRGDAPGVQLEGEPDATRPVEHRGNRVYRWSSNVVDLRNIGVGR
jgi:prepilin-type N-terminal cleavage/methylation domain-containing protein